MKTLLVDGNNLLARSDFAAKASRSQMSAGGVSTGALYLFINLLSKYVRMVAPTHVAVFWDAGHAFRDEAYPAYKAARKKPVDPNEETIPFALAKEFLSWAGVPHKAHTGYEADDLIAATARQCSGDTVILSGDKDLLQLVHDGSFAQGNRKVTQIRVPDDEPWTEDRVEKKFGVRPQHLPYYLALVGDPGDGVPGLKGIGPKRACALLEKVGWDWEVLMDLLGPEEAEQAALWRSLVDLRYYEYEDIFLRAHEGAPEFDPTGPTSLMHWPMLVDFCEKYELRSVIQRLQDGSLWYGEEAPKPSTEGLFEEVGDTPCTTGRSA